MKTCITKNVFCDTCFHPFVRTNENIYPFFSANNPINQIHIRLCL